MEDITAVDRARWYSSKVDRWLGLMLAVPPIAVVAVCVSSALAGSTAGLVTGIATAVLVGAIYLGLVFPTRYGLVDGYLLVRFGVCRRRIPLPRITEVHPTSNPLGAPALSLDRLSVRFGPGVFGRVMISPADREHFLEELAHGTGLKREGDRLVRM